MAVYEGKGGYRSAVIMLCHLIFLYSFGPGLPGRKELFGHTSRLESQPRGAVTRRAVAQRRKPRRRLDSPLGGGYPGF